MPNYEKKLKKIDNEIYQALVDEQKRQREGLELIASENYVSENVLGVVGSCLTNKYAEGYPSKRYYGGCENVDVVENLAIERVCKLFGAKYANVQPHSGSQANMGAYRAVLKPGDKVLGMNLNDGGHLTHGHSLSFSGQDYNFISYEVDPETGFLDYQKIEEIVKREQPKLIVAGASAYPRKIDFQEFARIAKENNALLMVDMAHIAGIVAAGYHQNPVDYADIVTTTTHKTLRGPRGGVILTNNEQIIKRINQTVFPGIQGGPLMHVIAAKAVAFGEALQPDFKDYATQIITNAKAMAETLTARGVNLVSGGTASHLMLIDLRDKGLTGAFVCDALASAHIVCNKNSVPNDPQKPSVTSGLRIGTPAGTTRGFGVNEFTQIAHMIADIIDACGKDEQTLNQTIATVRDRVCHLCQVFPIYDGGNV